MKKNNKRRLQKKQAIKKGDLVLGIDIGSKFHAVVFQDSEGRILKSFERIYNSERGFKYLKSEITKVMQRHGLKRVHVGFEPTGHYWMNIIYYLSGLGHEIHFIRTTAVKFQRELDDSSPSKTDLTDANHIATLTREGRYIDTKLQRGVYKELRSAGKLRAKIMKMKTSMICRLRMLIEMYFPEILDHFWAIDSVGMWRLIKAAPFPEDVMALGEEKLRELLKVPGVRKARLESQVSGILAAAGGKSIGLTASEFDRCNIENCIESLEMYHKQLLKIKKEMNKLLRKTEYYEIIMSVPGVGVVTAATLLGELGDPKNFSDAKSIIKFAGIDPKENSSGLKKSRSKLSKKGRYLMRTMLYFISMRLIYRADEFKKYYKRKLETKNARGRSLEKREALFAVAIKFVKVLFAMMRDKEKYCANKPGLRLAA